MEDINKKAQDDELNKAEEEIGHNSRKYVPVPKCKSNSKDETDEK